MRLVLTVSLLPLAAALPFLTSRAGGAGLELAAYAAQHSTETENAAARATTEAATSEQQRTAARASAATGTKEKAAIEAAAAVSAEKDKQKNQEQTSPTEATGNAATGAARTGKNQHKSAEETSNVDDSSNTKHRRARPVRKPHRSLITDAFNLVSSSEEKQTDMELALDRFDDILAAAAKDPDALEARMEEEDLHSMDEPEAAALRFVKGIEAYRHKRVEDPYHTTFSPDPIGSEESEAPFDLQNDVLQVVFSARKNGGHRQLQQLMAKEPHGLKNGSQGIAGSATGSNWYFVAMVMATLLSLDVCVLQHLPETTRTHLLLLIFWILLGFAIGGEMWVRTGSMHGTLWLEGFLLECTYGIDRALVWLFVLLVLGTPRRLMGKALTIGLLGSMVVRWIYLCVLPTLTFVIVVTPYLLGLWLVYAGARLVAAKEDDVSDCDVTQSVLVRVFRTLLGNRLAEFYDEDDEGLFVQVKGRLCVSLLFVAVWGIILLDSLISMDMALLKMERIPNGFLDISSAAIGGLIVRAGFFVVRDIVNIFALEKYCLGTIFFFLGAELLLGRTVYISAALSTGVAILILALSAGI
eukprot:CAMPEP_0206535356 /NCGR_PEP_ID=MMETSP0325_2-20121206/6087_1 /ASSEMBLY_ACC=CAM_ASM_000347 /TAXON_ID=2866 /ORGANISM="Crypthecodinium cohnii, Strain Seligo" /LENGTH=583 /DNA_ID=CAMNT_0054032325 /DNA_START=62 /DNA_END=1810 /DNA_ORIENTATION=+